MRLTLGQVAHWTEAGGEFDPQQTVDGYSIDSRSIRSGDLFFAVQGDRFDGHHFVHAALANGGGAAVVSENWARPEHVDASRLLRVPEGEASVLRAMQRLALAVRRTWGGRVVGVTGSAGKTTTKEAIAQVLGARFKVLKSAGNLNNGFGLPLQLLRLEAAHEIAVIEMGMNHAGEIAALARIAEPDWAVVSNVGPVHLEFFPDGLAGVARAKYELIEALPTDGVAVLNADDVYVRSFARGLNGRTLTYGFSEGADVRATHVEELQQQGVRFTVEANGGRQVVALQMLGRHNVMNALAAVATGLLSGMKLTECSDALAGLRSGEKRGEIIAWRGAKIVNDCYNSNPAALDAMVDALLTIPAVRHMVVAGEMLELGQDAPALHRDCGKRMAERGVTVVVGVRGAAAMLVDGAREAGAASVFLEHSAAAGCWMRDNLLPGDLVLLKGSRGVQLEKALSVLMDSQFHIDDAGTILL